MAKQKETITEELNDAIGYFPDWAKEFAQRYFTKTINEFILHGNVRDLVPTLDAKGKAVYVSLRDFLVNDLFGGRDIIVFYDRSGGIHFGDIESRKDFNRALSGYDTIFGTEYAKKLPRDPVRVFSVLENFIRLRLADGKRIAVIIDYAETIVPMAEASSYSSEDRNAMVYLQKWATEPLFLRSDFSICMITENLHNINQQIIQSPYTAEIQIQIPTYDDRFSFVNWKLANREKMFKELSEVSAQMLAQNTAGVNFVQLQTLLADVLENKEKLTFDSLSDRKKEIIESEAYGMLEFVESDYTLDSVAGHTKAKKHLRHAAKALKNGHAGVMPMGYLVSGPVGTGKTFMISCFAGEIGIPMLSLKNFRSQWQGVTEGNLDKILHLLDAMAPVAVMIDEADAALGDRDAQGDSGVSKRVFGQIASFMSNTKNRGRIVWFLVTARPDMMPIDLKRQGRAEEHIALFYPSTEDDRVELFKVMCKKTGLKLTKRDMPTALLDGVKTYSGADMEAILTRAKFRATAQTRSKKEGKVTKTVLEEVVEDFIPPTYPLEVERQNLVAVMECTSKELLPDEYANMTREDIIRRLKELQMLIGK